MLVYDVHIFYYFSIYWSDTSLLLHAAFAFRITRENLYQNIIENIYNFAVFGWIFRNVSLKF